MSKNIINDVSRVFKEVDPAGLLAGGAPDNEYDSEVNMVSVKLRAGVTEALLKDYIVELMWKRFEMELPSKKVNIFVKKLLDIHIS